MHTIRLSFQQESDCISMRVAPCKRFSSGVTSCRSTDGIPCPWSSFAQTPVVRFDYAVGLQTNVVGAVAACPPIGKHGEMVMAKVIEFYAPTIFHKPLKGALHEQCAKIIEFCMQPRKSA